MFVVEVGAALTTIFVARDIWPAARRRALRRPDRPLAVVHGAVRQLRRGDGGGARQGPGRHAAQDQDRRVGTARAGRRPRRGRAGHGAASRRRRPRASRATSSLATARSSKASPRRRVGDHRRERAGHPRIRRRSQRRHRRHARAVGLDQGAHHVQPRRDLPRSHDRARRRRPAAEDAERDRAEHPDRGPDAHLPAGGRDAAAVRGLRRRRARHRQRAERRGAGRRCSSA